MHKLAWEPNLVKEILILGFIKANFWWMPLEDTGQWTERATYNSAQKKRKNKNKKTNKQKTRTHTKLLH